MVDDGRESTIRNCRSVARRKTYFITSPGRAMIPSRPVMTISALTQQPRIADATPLALVRSGGPPHDLARALGVNLDTAQPVGDQILSARIEVPPGE